MHSPFFPGIRITLDHPSCAHMRAKSRITASNKGLYGTLQRITNSPTLVSEAWKIMASSLWNKFIKAIIVLLSCKQTSARDGFQRNLRRRGWQTSLTYKNGDGGACGRGFFIIIIRVQTEKIGAGKPKMTRWLFFGIMEWLRIWRGLVVILPMFSFWFWFWKNPADLQRCMEEWGIRFQKLRYVCQLFREKAFIAAY